MTQRIKGVMPILEYADGAWIGRILSTEGWSNTVLPLGTQVTGHWSEKPLEEGFSPIGLPGVSPYFVYIDPDGQTQGIIVTNNQMTRIEDAGGIGLGTLSGDARRRLIGFIYDYLAPENDNPINSYAQPNLRTPETLSDTNFNRKKTSKNARFHALLHDDPNIEISRAVTKYIRAKNLKPWSKETLRGPQNSGHILVFSSFNVWDNFFVVLLLHLNQPSPRWTLHVSRGSNPVDAPPLEQLGASDIGPFEALVDADMYVSESGLDAWLEENADLSGVERPELNPEPYLLLDEPPPLLWSNSLFTAWASGWGFS